MTMPRVYAHAADDFDRFVADLQVVLDHGTRHRTYQTIESVFRVFRRRLTVEQGLDFANVLPAVLRAIFVADWVIDLPILPFTDTQSMNREVQSFRINHDFSPDTAISDMADVLKRFVDPIAFRAVLDRLPTGAASFWNVTLE